MASGELARAVGQFSDWRWRINNLYWITDKQGRKVQFQMNWAQEALFAGMDYMNVILKARQLGFTTFIQVFMLDACLFNSNLRAGTIAHTLGDAQAIFRDKVKFPYDNLPDALKAAVPAVSDNRTELELANNSSIRVGTSLRSGTLQYLHISEYGKLCAKYPEKAREVRTGALNTVQAGQIVFIESTAEGQEGHFYEICEQAQVLQRTGAKLTPLDFKFFFFPWWKSDEYELDPAGVVIPQTYQEYFYRLEADGIKLRPGQKAWYVKKAETQQGDMKREFPSTPREAFEASVEGAYYGEQMARAELEQRIGAHPPLDGVPVNTAWDLGVGDATAIWFWQQFRGKLGIVGYYRNTGEGAAHYAGKLQEYQKRKGWKYGRHYFPHDAKVKEWGAGRTRLESLTQLGIEPKLVPMHTVDDGINAVRQTLPVCYFDEAETADGVKALKSYKKTWNEDRGCWGDAPLHDWASDGADGFRYLAMAWRDLNPADETPDPVAELLKPQTLNEMLEEHDRDTAE